MMYSSGYHGRNSGFVGPDIFFGLGLVFVLISAALYLFVPFAAFLALLSVCIAAICFIYYALRRAVEEGFFIRTAMALLWTIRIFFFAALLSFVILQCFILTNERTDSAAYDAEYVIVLGCGVDGERPSLMLQSRIDAAINYLRENPNATAILSGGQGPGEDITEAEAMHRAIISAGIDAERLILEQDSRDTIRNIRNSLELIGSENARIAVLSNDFHLYRAKMIARQEGCEISAVCALTPRADLSLTYHVREYFSLLKVFINYLIK